MKKQSVAAISALAVLSAVGVDQADADHRGASDTTVVFGVTPAGGSGKFYDDREAGQCGLTDWSCYMTLTADKHFTDSTVSSWLTGAKNDWNAAPTTVFIDLRTDQNSAYDIHFKISTLPNGTLGKITWADYHNNNCGGSANCGDPDGIASHQPQRWWYTYIEIDKAQTISLMNTNAKRKGVVSHEIGHALGLDHHGGCEGGVSPNTIMYVPCILSGITTPQPPDICEVTHASSPLMYGNDPNYQLQQC